jgi:voltage-gated potassium channel
MDSIRFRLRFYFIVLLVIIIFGTVLFQRLEGVTLIEAFYFIVVTIATVGYGDIHPVTTSGRILAIILIVLGVGTFLGVVANATELMLNRREQESITHKINMLIGVFFSEVGAVLIKLFSSSDPDIHTLRGSLQVKGNWQQKDFDDIGKIIGRHLFQPDIRKVDLSALSAFLQDKRPFMVRLLIHPTLQEHEKFSELLRAVFHLTEELDYRQGHDNLPPADMDHLAGDIKRVYKSLVSQWIMYMKHLKINYPYLFSLAVRMNPYNPESNPIVTD